MALIVEDGSVVAGAESYCTVAYATTYFANRGNAVWAGLASDTVREQLLRKATDYMLQAYKLGWKGVRVSAAQALDWPRYGVFTEPVVYGRSLSGMAVPVAGNIVPLEVQKACAELALRANSADLAPDLEKNVLSEKIGPMAVNYDSTSDESPRYRAIDLILKAYLEGSPVIAKVVRT